MRPAVRAEGLGKRFQHTVPRHHTLIGRLRYHLGRGVPAPSVWALRDASFEVSPGQCLGISGPNGAGKSTLLKLIAGILDPSEGRVETGGRTNTFFQIGAGVQDELSVRDNIEISGILMGLRRREILRRIDAVLDFAELAHYADVRMAELSTGQSARVVFSTALHAELDILLVDEVLAVGDAAFQDKCMKAFRKLREEGKTVLLASHEQALLEEVCTHQLRLHQGRVESLLPVRAPAERIHG